MQISLRQRTSKAVEDMDRLQMHDKLRRAEGRVAALEKELLDNTRRWARDKADLQVTFLYSTRAIYRDSFMTTLYSFRSS